MKIYLEKKHHQNSVDEQIEYLLTLRYFPKTFLNKGCNVMQCNGGKSRSLNEFFYIIKTIFPFASRKYVYTTIFSKLWNDKNSDGTLNYNKCIMCCPDVHKLVIHSKFCMFTNHKYYLNDVIFDYKSLIKEKHQLRDKVNIFYFLKLAGFKHNEIQSIIYNDSNNVRKRK